MQNFELIAYGVAVAWMVVALYVASMAARQRKLTRELAGIRSMLEGAGR